MRTNRAIVLSLLFASVIMIIPWEVIRGKDFYDKTNYFNYALYGVNRLEYVSFDSLFSYIFNEWLWHFIILNVDKYITYTYFFNGVSIISLFSMSFYLLKRQNIYSLILLVNPLVINLVMSQYRISFAMSVILLAIHIKKFKKLKFLLVFISTLIHSSVLIFIFIYLAILIAKKLLYRQHKIYLFILVLMGLSISLIMSGYVDVILEAVGDRRSDYETDSISSSVSYLSFWILNFFMLLLYYFKRPINHPHESISIVVLSNITFNVIFGGYSTRVLAVMFPVLMNTNLRIGAYYKILIFIVFVVYTYLQWVYWLNY